MRFALRLPFTVVKRQNSFSLSSLGCFSSLLIVFMTCCWTLPICLMFFLNCWDQKWTQYSTYNLNSAEWNRVTTSLLLLIMPLQTAAGDLIYPHYCSRALLIMFSLLSTRTPICFSSRQFPSHTDYYGLISYVIPNE